MKTLKTILLLFIGFAAYGQDAATLDTLRIPSEILIDRAVQPNSQGQYPYPRPIDCYDAVEVQFRENKKVTSTLYFIALIDEKTGQLKYTEIKKENFKLIKAKK